jgi:hypothetical protein
MNYSRNPYGPPQDPRVYALFWAVSHCPGWDEMLQDWPVADEPFLLIGDPVSNAYLNGEFGIPQPDEDDYLL